MKIKTVLMMVLLTIGYSQGQITQQELQKAIDAAPEGGTVTIPNGSYTWTGQLVINKTVHLLGESKNRVKITNNNTSSNMLDVTASKTGSIEIANLDIDSMQNNVYVFSIRTNPAPDGGGKPILLHDCAFKTGYRYAIEWDTNGGVVWDCVFDGSKSGGVSGISFVARSLPGDWTKVSTLGKLDTGGESNTYIEDCVFEKTIIGCMNLDDNSRVVVRHCTFDNSQIGSHGQETSVAGSRQWELYNNKFVCDKDNPFNLNTFVQLRGGTGVITDNDFDNIPWGKNKIQLCVFNIRRKGQIPCQTTYPAARQVGQGWIGDGGYNYPSVPANGPGYVTDPICIWGNTGEGAKESNFVGLSDYQPDECGNGKTITDFVKLDRDYKLGPKEGYEKIAFPHPLRGGGGGSTSPAPPVEEATPPAVEEATPKPSPTYNKWIERQSDWSRKNPPVPDDE